MSYIKEVLSDTPRGRRALESLAEAKPNGRTLELVTANITAETMADIKHCMGDTGATLGGRFDMDAAFTNKVCRGGLTSKPVAAQIRLHILEGIPSPQSCPRITSHQISLLVDVCGSQKGLAEELGMNPKCLTDWVRHGLGGSGQGKSRWPYVIAMATPWVMEVAG